MFSEYSRGFCYGNTLAIRNGLVDIKPYDVFKVMEEKCASQVLSKEGIALNQLNKEKPFFALFPRLENKNYNAFLKNKEKMLSFLKELSNDNFFNALILINSRVNNSFTANLFVKELSIPLERAKEIIDLLIDFKLLNVSKLELDDEIIDNYTLNDNPAVLGLFAFLDMIVERPHSFYYYNKSRDGHYFDLKK